MKHCLGGCLTAGVLFGAALAIGGSLLILATSGTLLGTMLMTVIALLCLLIGGGLAITCAFLGLVGHAAGNIFGFRFWGPAVRGNGVRSLATRLVPNFTSVRFNLPGTLEITAGSDLSLVVEADENVQPWITTEVRDGTLTIHSTAPFSSETDLRVIAGVPTLAGVDMLGAGEGWARNLSGESFRLAIKGPGDFTTTGTARRVNVALVGSGDAKLEQLAADEVNVRIAGSGDCTASGTTRRLTVDIVGSGDAHLRELAAQEVEAAIMGCGDISVAAERSLKAKIVGSGDIEYTGDPQVTQKIVGSGEVKKVIKQER